MAAIGPGTLALEAAATAVGAGIVLGGFVAGTTLLFDRGGGDRTQPVADAGYGGVWVAVLALVVDLLR
jgi:hypothetical protein